MTNPCYKQHRNPPSQKARGQGTRNSGTGRESAKSWATRQVGGFVAYGQTNGNATTFTAVNVAGMASFTGETTWAPIINGATGSNIDPNSLNNPNGPSGQFHNITQNFTWTENNLCKQGG